MKLYREFALRADVRRDEDGVPIIRLSRPERLGRSLGEVTLEVAGEDLHTLEKAIAAARAMARRSASSPIPTQHRGDVAASPEGST